MKHLSSLITVLLFSTMALATEATSSKPESFADVLGACKIETSTQCGKETSQKGQVSCLSKKSTDPQAKFTTGCRRKIADQKK